MCDIAEVVTDDGIVLLLGPVEEEGIQQEGVVRLYLFNRCSLEDQSIELRPSLLVPQLDLAHPEHIHLLETQPLVRDALLRGQNLVAEALDQQLLGLGPQQSQDRHLRKEYCAILFHILASQVFRELHYQVSAFFQLVLKLYLARVDEIVGHRLVQLIADFGDVCDFSQQEQFLPEFFLGMLEVVKDCTNLRNVVREYQAPKNHHQGHHNCLGSIRDQNIPEATRKDDRHSPVNAVHVLTGPLILIDAIAEHPVVLWGEIGHRKEYSSDKVSEEQVSQQQSHQRQVLTLGVTDHEVVAYEFIDSIDQAKPYQASDVGKDRWIQLKVPLDEQQDSNKIGRVQDKLQRKYIVQYYLLEADESISIDCFLHYHLTNDLDDDNCNANVFRCCYPGLAAKLVSEFWQKAMKGGYYLYVDNSQKVQETDKQFEFLIQYITVDSFCLCFFLNDLKLLCRLFQVFLLFFDILRHSVGILAPFEFVNELFNFLIDVHVLNLGAEVTDDDRVPPLGGQLAELFADFRHGAGSIFK